MARNISTGFNVRVAESIDSRFVHDGRPWTNPNITRGSLNLSYEGLISVDTSDNTIWLLNTQTAPQTPGSWIQQGVVRSVVISSTETEQSFNATTGVLTLVQNPSTGGGGSSVFPEVLQLFNGTSPDANTELPVAFLSTNVEMFTVAPDELLVYDNSNRTLTVANTNNPAGDPLIDRLTALARATPDPHVSYMLHMEGANNFVRNLYFSHENIGAAGVLLTADYLTDGSNITLDVDAASSNFQLAQDPNTAQNQIELTGYSLFTLDEIDTSASYPDLRNVPREFPAQVIDFGGTGATYFPEGPGYDLEPGLVEQLTIFAGPNSSRVLAIVPSTSVPSGSGSLVADALDAQIAAFTEGQNEFSIEFRTAQEQFIAIVRGPRLTRDTTPQTPTTLNASAYAFQVVEIYNNDSSSATYRQPLAIDTAPVGFRTYTGRTGAIADRLTGTIGGNRQRLEGENVVRRDFTTTSSQEVFPGGYLIDVYTASEDANTRASARTEVYVNISAARQIVPALRTGTGNNQVINVPSTDDFVDIGRDNLVELIATDLPVSRGEIAIRTVTTAGVQTVNYFLRVGEATANVNNSSTFDIAGGWLELGAEAPAPPDPQRTGFVTFIDVPAENQPAVQVPQGEIARLGTGETATYFLNVGVNASVSVTSTTNFVADTINWRQIEGGGGSGGTGRDIVRVVQQETPVSLTTSTFTYQRPTPNARAGTFEFIADANTRPAILQVDQFVVISQGQDISVTGRVVAVDGRTFDVFFTTIPAFTAGAVFIQTLPGLFPGQILKTMPTTRGANDDSRFFLNIGTQPDIGVGTNITDTGLANREFWRELSHIIDFYSTTTATYDSNNDDDVAAFTTRREQLATATTGYVPPFAYISFRTAPEAGSFIQRLQNGVVPTLGTEPSAGRIVTPGTIHGTFAPDARFPNTPTVFDVSFEESPESITDSDFAWQYFPSDQSIDNIRIPTFTVRIPLEENPPSLDATPIDVEQYLVSRGAGTSIVMEYLSRVLLNDIYNTDGSNSIDIPST